MRAGQLKLVAPRPSTEDVLREAFQARDEAAAQLRQVDAIIAAELKVLAKERGVIFLRPETVRRELAA